MSVSPETWRALFSACAFHVPGLGGVQGFNALTYNEVSALLEYVRSVGDAKRKALEG